MKFRSKYKGYQIVLKPQRVILVDGTKLVEQGIRVEFDKRGEYETDDPKIIELLKADRYYNGDFEEEPEEIKKAKAKISKIEKLINEDKEQEITELKDEKVQEIEEDEPEDKVLGYRDFQSIWYDNNEGGLSEFQVAWKAYKKENNI